MTHLEVKIPLDLIKIVTPADGLPCVGDFLTCCVSFIFSGSRLHREPLDLNWSNKSIEKFDIVKGFTRLTLDYKQCICLFVFCLSYNFLALNEFVNCTFFSGHIPIESKDFGIAFAFDRL